MQYQRHLIFLSNRMKNGGGNIQLLSEINWPFENVIGFGPFRFYFQLLQQLFNQIYKKSKPNTQYYIKYRTFT